MNKLSSAFSMYLMIGLAVLGFMTQTNAQTARNERGIRDTLRSLNSKVDDFRYSLDNELGRIAVSRDEENQINDDTRDFESSLAEFGDKLDRRRENADDVQNVLTAAQTVNDFLNARRFGSTTQKDWMEIRGLLNRLAANYQVSWNWNGGGNQNYPTGNSMGGSYPTTTSFNNTLTGTYRLDAARSEDARDIAERAIRNDGARNDSDAQSDLEDKLEVPEQVVIEVRGSQVTLASSNAAQLTFTADGRDRTENTADGKTIRVRSTLRGQELTVSSLGGETDYTIIFASIDGGKADRKSVV